jgi:N-acetyl-gamma-glutamyl-phosphate reductase
MNRGILSTIYVRLAAAVPAEELRALYLDFYKAAPFVRVRPLGFEPRTAEVRGTNFCDLSLYPDPRSGLVKVISAIDNLCRGASGQALANFNLLNGWAETEGLSLAPLYP